MKVQNTPLADLLGVLGNTGMGEDVPDGFQDLLGVAITNTGKPAGKTGGEKQTEAVGQGAAPETDDVSDDTAAMAALAGVVTPVQQEPEAEQQVPDEAQAVEQLTLAIPIVQGGDAERIPLAIPDLPVLGEEEQTADDMLVSTQTTVVADVEEAAAPQETVPQLTATPELGQQDRFTQLLGNAQQQLQTLQQSRESETVEQPKPVEQPTLMEPELAAPEERTEPMEPAAPETTAPVQELPQEPAAEIDLPEPEPQQPQVVNPEAVATAEEEPIQEQEAQPVESAAAPVQKSAPSAAKTEAKPVLDERPLRELPQADRAVMEMQETKPVTTQTQEAQPEEPKAAQVETQRVEPVRQVEPRQQMAEPVTEVDQMEQVRAQMDENLAQNRMEFRMQLQPEELGKVDVKMVLESGRLAVEIIAANPRSADLLSRQAQGLVQSLRLQDFEVDTVHVVTETQSAGAQMDGAFNMWNGQAHADGEDAAGYGGSSRHTDDQQADGEIEQVQQTERQKAPDALMDYAV